MGAVLGLLRLLAIVLWRLTRLILLLLWLGIRATLRRRRSGQLGSARFATSWEMTLAGVRRGHGPIVGRLGRSFLRFNRDGMIAVFAPMGAGKGVGIVIPNLLSYRGSIVCTDIKGENFAITARHRRTLGPVFVLNTASPALSDVFNPLNMVRVGTWHEKDDAEALAKLMVIPERHDSHWDSKAEGLLTCLILHTVHQEPERRTLAHVRTLSTLGPDSLKELLHTIATDGSRHAAELATSFLSMEGSEEFRNVLSNTEKATRVWSAGSPAGEISGRSSFRISDLVDNVATLYLIVDEEKLAVYAGFLRVLVGCVINTLTRSKEGRRPKRKVLLLLDEAAALGRLEPLERGVGFLRAYCTPLLVFQDMAQLKALYQRANSFLANATCKVFFNVADLDAAKFVSEIIGQATTAARSQTVSQANTELVRESHSSGVSETGRWLLDRRRSCGFPETPR
ncbi:MAG: type IV secretory system conjugative DNA transfer family protein [Proteobacteria bacterium]|nr:type IV secretory system conjugative DNA transfer family protein [Pseudomonadota bacterium]